MSPVSRQRKEYASAAFLGKKRHGWHCLCYAPTGEMLSAMREAWNHNIHYHDVVLREMPSPCKRAIDIGCGEGWLTRKMAERCDRVLGIDLDAGVISAALRSDLRPANVSFLAGDAMTYGLPLGSFDFIATVATLHHLPLEPALLRLRDLLAPGGVLIVIGLYRLESSIDYSLAAIACPISWAFRHVRRYVEMTAPMQEPRTSLREIRRAARDAMPGAELNRRLLFRYSLLRRKPG